MGEVILKIENGTKKFKNELIFQNVSMEFEKGNSYGFVGPNGCGKSVFFKTLCGYSPFDRRTGHLPGKNYRKRAGFY